jgi:sugar phosphate isomerase/epimerase
LTVSSLQSIWRGREENIFESEAARRALAAHTRQAIAFAVAVGCRNLVFGCPKNRNIPAGLGDPLAIAQGFFAEIADAAQGQGVVIALEPNPPYYGTNFINTTAEAFAFCQALNHGGLQVNVDVGTCVHYGESVDFLAAHARLIHHVHISEPLLVPVVRRGFHAQLKNLPFAGYFSIEMADPGSMEVVRQTAEYVREVLR